MPGLEGKSPQPAHHVVTNQCQYVRTTSVTHAGGECLHMSFWRVRESLMSRYIWGRGAQDVKITIFAMLEAVTSLLDQG